MAKMQGWGGAKFLWSYHFIAVTGKSEENQKFFASTPSGNVEFSAVHADLFEPGKEYYFDISEA